MRTGQRSRDIRFRYRDRTNFEMEEMLARVWENLGLRLTGPMWFRTVMQPAVAIFFAVRDGLNDARLGRPAYLWKIFTNHGGHRRELIHDGWTSIAKVFFMAMLIDVVYQFIVQRWVYPLEIFLVAVLLAVIPYILIRGPINRILRRLGGPKPAETTNNE